MAPVLMAISIKFRVGDVGLMYQPAFPDRERGYTLVNERQRNTGESIRFTIEPPGSVDDIFFSVVD